MSGGFGGYAARVAKLLEIAGVEQPQASVEWHDLTVSTRAVVGSAGVSTVGNTVPNLLKVRAARGPSPPPPPPSAPKGGVGERRGTRAACGSSPRARRLCKAGTSSRYGSPRALLLPAAELWQLLPLGRTRWARLSGSHAPLPPAAALLGATELRRPAVSRRAALAARSTRTWTSSRTSTGAWSRCVLRAARGRLEP